MTPILVISEHPELALVIGIVILVILYRYIPNRLPDTLRDFDSLERRVAKLEAIIPRTVWAALEKAWEGEKPYGKT